MPEFNDIETLLTAHALGEPLTAEQRARVDAALAADPSARQAVTETEHTADLLRHALQAEPDLPEPLVKEHVMKSYAPWIAVAATLIFFLGMGFYLLADGAAHSRISAMKAEVAERDAEQDEAADALTDARGRESSEPAAGAVQKRLDALAATPADEQLARTAESAEATEEQFGRLQDKYNESLEASPAEMPAAADADSSLTTGATRSSASVVPEQAAGPAAAGDMPVLDVSVVASRSEASAMRREQRSLKQQVGALPKQFGQTEIGDLDLVPDAELDDVFIEPEFNTEAYDRIVDNPFRAVADEPLSTFGVDVDTASYANVRRFLNSGQLPPPDAVRVEELVNYFPYDYAPPAADSDVPFAADLAVAKAPWNERHKLVRIALKGREIDQATRPAANLVFLLDVSGSMDQPNKLPLVKSAMKTLVDSLRGDDRVAIVTYAGASGLVLDSTPADAKVDIAGAIDLLTPGGGTRGSAGIELAYDVATKNFIEDGINRVILATDGDFNLGVTDRGQLTRLIEDKAATGTYLTLLGFGEGNVKDATMEELSNKGDGNYAYVDTKREAEKVLSEQVGGTLMAIAKDVKLQVEFNPAAVAAYRLVGYENRVLANEDFNDDTKDAGDLGAGHTVTAFYEIIPAGQSDEDIQAQLAELKLKQQQLQDAIDVGGLTPATVADLRRQIEANMQQVALLEAAPTGEPGVDDLKYQYQRPLADGVDASELLTVKLRYKEPDAPKEQGTSKLLSFPLKNADTPFAETDDDFRFAAAVAGWGMLLRHSPHAGSADYDWVLETAGNAVGDDGYRQAFLDLARRSRDLSQEN